ncbi:helix-turn-helix domain containing protein [Candidatus Termititenax aidoneus]|uniref:Helix-turn-helix domain containing protein n=1 Tax=Termititenax aidoneus TaxID=2218524 RepID=A0A388TCL3_TERA1|nr:helix-turn-helix domain containing protein [Candidatus Termititenax aidoneus]
MSIDFTNADLKKIVSRKLELLRKQSGQTIDSAAAELEMDRSEFFRILKGKRLPMLRSMFRISKRYGVSMDWWFVGIDELPKRAVAGKNPREYQLLRIFKNLPERAQKTVLATVKTLARNLKN